MPQILFCVCLFLVLSIRSSAQEEDFDSFRNKILNEMDSFRKETYEDYTKYRKEINDRYAQFLRESWKMVKKNASHQLPKEIPYPIPIYEEDEKEIKDSSPIVIEEIIPIDSIIKENPVPIVPINPDIPIKAKLIKFTFMGTEMEVAAPQTDKRLSLSSITNNNIADAWAELSSGKYEELLTSCIVLKQKYDLCDWAYLLCIKTISDSLFGKNTNEAKLLLGWLFCQSGYQIRLCQSHDTKLGVLFASKHIIYCYNYYKIDGIDYYNLFDDFESIQACNAPFEGEKMLSLAINKQPKFARLLSNEKFLCAANDVEMAGSVRLNKNLLDFYNTYPTSTIGENVCTRWALYANTPLSTEAETFVNSFKNKLNGLSEYDAVNRILHFVQTAFVYEQDDKVWGEDRAFFAEETLYYPYADCEDRSILFSKFVRELYGLPILLVFYPGHLATAIGFNDIVNGDYILYDGKKYTIADPTYIGAPIGHTMPELDNKKAKIILLQ